MNKPVGVPSGWEEIAAYLWYVIPMKSAKTQCTRMRDNINSINIRFHTYRDWRVIE